MVVIDTETTGLDHKTEQLIEVAAVRLDAGEITEKYTSLVKPTVPIRRSSFEIHHISEEMVADAPSIETVLPEFLAFIGDRPIVAHNALFDYSFVNEACKKHLETRFRNDRIDTLDMYRCVFPEEVSHGLSSLLARFGMESHVEHRALDDAECLARVYPKLRDLYEQRFSWQIDQLKNIPYLMERYLRLQKTVHMLQAEMGDLKEIFKFYFQEGGRSVTSSQGDVMVSTMRRSYEYDDALVWPVIFDSGMVEKAAKLTPRYLDKMIDKKMLDPDLIDRLKEARTRMVESKGINFIKPVPASDAPASDAPASDAPAAEEETTAEAV